MSTKPVHALIVAIILFSCGSDNIAEMIDIDNTPPPQATGMIPCENGQAGIYPCNGYDLMARISLEGLGGGRGNDIWGWTDPSNGDEYALMGLNNGTVFIRITDPENPVIIGRLPTATVNSSWRDIKVYNNFAYIVSEAQNHGVQVFDLTRLRNVTNPPMTFNADNRFTEAIGNCHNIVINENTAFAYAVGTARDNLFNGGVHFINLANPGSPIAAGGYGDDGYTHDGQVVTYLGPDADYTGREIFIGSNENEMVIGDFTDKDSPQGISSITYSNLAYTHQGWFTEDQRFFILGDELDESNFGFPSRTLVFDLLDLDNPILHMEYSGPTNAIDHNGYVNGDDFFLANYTAGVRVIDISDIENRNMTEIGFFDTFPANNSANFNGVWSVYPYFESGNIIISDIDSGFFIIRRSN